jgi:phage gp36-like protein
MPIIKQPAEEIVIELRFAAQLAALATLVSVSVTPRGWAAGALLIVTGQQIVGTSVLVKVAGGVDGEAYLVSARASGDGQTLEAEADVYVVELGFTLPDGTHPYCSPRDYIDRYGYEETVRVTDAAQSGKIDKRRLFAAMADAQAEIDSYVSVRYALPLTVPVPPLITTMMHILTRGYLHIDADASHPARVAYGNSVKALDQMARGITKLVGAAPATPPLTTTQSDNEVVMLGVGPVNSAASLKGF